MSYTPPLSEFRFLLDHVVGFEAVRGTDRHAEVTADLTGAVLAEAGRLCADVMAPLRRAGDLHPAVLDNGIVRTAPGMKAAYDAMADGGWICVSAPPEHGGMGLPITLQTAINDMMSAANLGLQNCALLTQGQIEAISAHGSEALRATYLPKLISGAWSGTMNLTEPQAGTDVGALTTRAEPAEDGTYRITGQKIYITYGDSDLVENVVHLVLARLPEAPAGTKGISLFLVPKRLPAPDGTPGPANAVSVSGLEHKMGLHASPTCTMIYDGATGWIVGEEGGGMAAMFTMMNNARLGVGVQGIGVADAATQAALAWALERKQGRTPTGSGDGTIVEHADVRRMLAGMRAETFAARGLALSCAVALDMSHATGSAEWRSRAAFLTPIVKAYGTDVGHEAAQTAIQVHGGMGYVEETGVAQFARDIRVAAIYEGTNGIQAMDLVGRKLSDNGEVAYRLLDEVQTATEAARPALPILAQAVWQAAETLRETTEHLVEQSVQERFAGAVPFLRCWARVLGAHLHLKAAMAEGGGGPRTALAAFHIEWLLPEHDPLAVQARAGAEGLYALTPEALAAA
jgi:alkylation response protein AidB-like acyl-CoA dehydrogenase